MATRVLRLVGCTARRARSALKATTVGSISRRLMVGAAFAGASVKECFAMDEQPSNPKQLTLHRAQELVREMIITFDRPDVSDALEKLLAAAQDDRTLMIELVMPFVNQVQAKVIAGYGFERSTAGVLAFGQALAPHKADPAMAALLVLLKSRIMPSAEQAEEMGHSRRAREEMGITLHDMEDSGAMCWSVPAESLTWMAKASSSSCTQIEAVPGACAMKGVLCAEECERIIALTEAMGFHPSEGLTSGHGARQNMFTQWWVTPAMADELFERVRSHLPATVHGYRLCGLNLRFRVYKYEAAGGQQFLPHFDDGWEGTTMGWEEDCLAHWEAALESCEEDAPVLDDQEQPKTDPRDEMDPTKERQWVSRMSVLLYLNTVSEGGGTSFWEIDPAFKPDPKCSYEENMKAAAQLKHTQNPEAGTALCYFHGAHEMSALHSGDAVVSTGPKYVIRTDVMYLAPN